MGAIRVIRADITTLEVDVIVNAANTSLLGGGGVDGAIHRAGGPAILDECREIVARQGGCPTGEAVITTAGALPARWVVHAVGPIHGRNPAAAPGLLANCYRRSLALAAEAGATSIAFPSISTGAYGYPVGDAAAVAMEVLVAHVRDGGQPSSITMCCFSQDDVIAYATAHDALAQPG